VRERERERDGVRDQAAILRARLTIHGGQKASLFLSSRALKARRISQDVPRLVILRDGTRSDNDHK
jgi:hypothetical protein